MTTSYAIHCDPCYYQGTLNCARPGLLTPWMESQCITVASEAEADALCSMLNDSGSGPYMLSHGQYAAPQHTVRKTALPVRHTLLQAMCDLQLQYDFASDGSRLSIPAPY